MTSDSITEQAARAMWDADRADPGQMNPWHVAPEFERDEYRRLARALADAGLLAHQAPATEDEAAEVEAYCDCSAVGRMLNSDPDHLVGPCPMHSDYPDEAQS